MKNSRISSGSILMTEACNLRCEYCYIPEKGAKHMSNDMAERVVDFLITGAINSSKNSIDITFFGGEPTLNVPTMRYMFDYARRECNLRKLGYNFGIISNSTNESDEYFDFIKHCKDCGVNIHIQLSIDGIPEVLNNNRKSKTIDNIAPTIISAARKHVEKFKEFGIPLYQLVAHGCINKFALPYTKQNYDFIRDEIGIDRIWFMPIHEEDWSSDDVDQYHGQLNLIGRRIIKECAENNSPKYFNDFSQFNCNSMKQDVSCGAGLDYCAIDPEGYVWPCHRFRGNTNENAKILLGKLNMDNASETELDESVYNEFNHTRIGNMFGVNNCFECVNKECKICYAANMNYNLDMLIGFPKYCKMSLKEQEIRYRIRRELENRGIVVPLPEANTGCNCPNHMINGDQTHSRINGNPNDQYIKTSDLKKILEEYTLKMGEVLNDFNSQINKDLENVNKKCDELFELHDETLSILEQMVSVEEN